MGKIYKSVTAVSYTHLDREDRSSEDDRDQ